MIDHMQFKRSSSPMFLTINSSTSRYTGINSALDDPVQASVEVVAQQNTTTTTPGDNVHDHDDDDNVSYESLNASTRDIPVTNLYEELIL